MPVALEEILITRYTRTCRFLMALLPSICGANMVHYSNWLFEFIAEAQVW
jgi:hypothetical protein